VGALEQPRSDLSRPSPISRPYLVVRYGSFFQTVHPISGGHLSVAVEPEADPLALIEGIRTIAREHGPLE
jgi:hypothetical protein